LLEWEMPSVTTVEAPAINHRVVRVCDLPYREKVMGMRTSRAQVKG
jgi:hypothetical protein